MSAKKIPWAKPHSFPEEVTFVTEAIKSNWISEGAWLTRFEREFAEIHKVPFALSTSNGTTALQLALIALEIEAGDEVIVPNFSFVAPGNMVLACGATPVFADVNEDDWNLSPDSLLSKITSRTKAVIYVHNYGVAGDIVSVRALCKERGLALIEDNAEAAFSKFKGQFTGTFSDVGCFSFQATKTITTGEGGMVVTHRQEVYDRMKVVRSHGMEPSRRYWHTELGHNFRLTNLQAAFGCAQLSNLEWIIKRRKELHSEYVRRLTGLNGIKLQSVPKECEPVMWAFGLRLDNASEERRDQIRTALAEEGIETRPGFYPYTRMPFYEKFRSAGQLEVSERISRQILLLPFFPDLENSEVDYICRRLTTHLEN